MEIFRGIFGKLERARAREREREREREIVSAIANLNTRVGDNATDEVTGPYANPGLNEWRIFN